MAARFCAKWPTFGERGNVRLEANGNFADVEYVCLGLSSQR
jgi:hypothetical protein